MVGGTYTPADEHGDARVFTQALARRCAVRGAELLFGHDIERLEVVGTIELAGFDLRLDTPTNIPLIVPLIGRLPLQRLWINAGHGTLGWTHSAGSGRALAELMSGERPAVAMDFVGFESRRRAATAASAPSAAA